MFPHIFVRVHRVEESTWFFFGFWFSITCNLSVGSYTRYCITVFCAFDFPILQLKFYFSSLFYE